MLRELVIGIDIGGTRTKAGLVDIRSGKVLQMILEPTETSNPTLFMEQMDAIVKTCTQVAYLYGSPIEGIGFGIPGFTSSQGVVETTFGSLTFMENYPLKAFVEASFGLPCHMDNDARVVSLGEALFGKGKGYDRVLTLTLGTGVGLGFVVNTQFVEPLPFAHMGGHMKISDVEVLCYCGKSGCLEALISATGILNLIAQSQSSVLVKDAEAIFALANEGNKDAEWVVERLIGYLHTAIHNYVNLFAPDIIILGGGIAKGLSTKLSQIKGHNYMTAYPDYKFELVVSDLEEYAGVLGSAALFNHSKKLNFKHVD